MKSKNESSLLCLVVDDESLGRRLLIDYVKEHPDLTLATSCKNTSEAATALVNYPIDLMFLDIQMPGMKGTDFLKTLHTPPATIFVTAFTDYAVEGFALNVVDYLVKPVGFERFSTAVAKVIEQRNAKHPIPEVVPTDSTTKEKKDSIFVHVEYALVKVMIADILFIEGMKDYVKINLDNGQKRVVTKSTLKAIEAKIGSASFFRCHKSYLINIDKIQSIRNNTIVINGHEIPISKVKHGELMSKLDA